MNVDTESEEMIVAENENINFNFIDRFPDVYRNIFSFMDVKNLLNCCLVCKSWNELIGQSSELMKKVHFNFLKHWQDLDFETVSSSKRKIFHLSIGPVSGMLAAFN